jgi:hypothetical protein
MLTLWGKEGYGWSPIVEAGKGVSTGGRADTPAGGGQADTGGGRYATDRHACWGILPQGIVLVTAACNGRPFFVTAA